MASAATPIDHSSYEKMPHTNTGFTLAPKWTRKVKAHAIRPPSKPGETWGSVLRKADRKNLLGLWCATEKCHGANFCLVVERGAAGALRTRAAKRSQYLDPTVDRFFGFQRAMAEHSLVQKAEQLFRMVEDRAMFANLSCVRIYGELFGGLYPHKVAAVPAEDKQNDGGSTTSELKDPDNVDVVFDDDAPVQREILYAPSVHFYAFDVACSSSSATATAGHASHSDKQYLDFVDAIQLFEAVGMFHAVPLVVGSLDDVTNAPVDFITTIPPRLKLQSLPDNKAEGLVIRPLITLYSAPTKKDGKGPPQRVMWKRKAESFAERLDLHQSSASLQKHSSKTAQVVALVSCFITPSRYAGVISKLGRPNAGKAVRDKAGVGKRKKQTAQSAGGVVTGDAAVVPQQVEAHVEYFTQDVWEDALADEAIHERFHVLSAQEQDSVRLAIRQQIVNLVLKSK